jgi:DMSO/TMAO reductase YedYZ molybdopterin-dependent catalytic subunit
VNSSSIPPTQSTETPPDASDSQFRDSQFRDSQFRDSRFRRLARGTLAGLAAAAVGLAVAEVVATTSKKFQSPVLDVADRVVDGVPQSVKRLAIRWFGTNDKIALLVGIATILAAYAAVVGVITLGRTRQRLYAGLIGISLFGAAGAYASQSTRRAAPFIAVAPSVVGAVAAGLTLVGLRRVLLGSRKATESASATTAEMRSPTANPSIAMLTPSDRRRFLAAAGVTTLGAVVVGTTARRLGTNNTAAASRRSTVLPAARAPLAAVPADISSTAPGVTPFFTPNRDFYRIDTAITVPQVPIDGWKLTVRGMVDRPLTLTFEDLIDRELIESDITLTCVSNEVGGKLMGTARWLGIRVDDLLRDAGMQADADQIVGRSVDGYTCGFPVAALDGRDALVAIGMNGEPLPLQHGFPARLIVPGLYGYVSATKWLTELEVTRFDRFDQYWVERGWVSDAPIKVQSRIDTPKGLSKVAAGTVAVGGIAWAQTRGIDRVEVRVDDGEWAEATLAAELNDVTWRQWSYAWQAMPGRHTLTVRATERNGPIQTEERSEPFPSGATGQHSIVVIVS